MQRAVGLVVALGLSAALVSCGSATTSRSAPAPQTTSSTLSRTQLQTRLLTVGDVGSAWQKGQDQVGEAITPEDLASVGTSIPCSDVAMDPALAKRLTAVTGVQFQPADHSPKHLIELVITGQPGQLDSDLRALVGIMDTCAARTATTTGTSNLTLKKLALPTLGEQQAAYVMTDSVDSSGVFYVRNAIVRRGSVAVVLGLMEGLATVQDKPQISDATFVAMLRTAVDKVHG